MVQDPFPSESHDAAAAALRVQIAALTADLEDARETLRTLREREAILKSAVANAPFGVAMAPLGGPLGETNQRFCEIVGYTRDELRAIEVRSLTHPDDWPIELRLIAELLAGERSHYVLEKRYIRKDGSLAPVRIVGLLARDDAGNPLQAVAFVEDISEQVRVTDALRQSEARYRSLVEDQLDMILRWRADGLRVYVNDACCRFFGRTREELLDGRVGQFTYPPDLAAVQAALAQLRPEAPDVMVQNRALRADGRIVWTEWNVKGIFAADGALVEAQAVGRDISARRDAEATRDWLVGALEASPDWVSFLDENGALLYLNGTARRMYALPADPDYAALRLADYYPAWAWRALNDAAIPAARRNDTWQGELALYDASGGEIPVLQTVLALRETSGAVARLALIAHDLSAQKRVAAERLALERKLLDTQKLESLGLLAGGIAHDFNNILTAILGHTELALIDPGLHAETRRSLEIVMTGVQRAADLTEAILAYAGKGRLSLESVDLNAIVRELTDLLIVSALRHCMLSLELLPDLPAIAADPAQIRQMILNLLVNAAEAIDPTGGTVRLRTHVVWIEPEAFADFAFAEELHAGWYVYVSLEDTGSGMDAATLARIFDPFFTTKFAGRGMGLAAVQGIVRAHRGTMRVQSTLGVGTRFELWLPALDQPAPPAVLAEPERELQQAGPVLVIDDEPDVRTVATRMLERLGFQVLIASNGPEALAMLPALAARLAVVFVDLTMPQMRGDAVAATIREQYPDLPLVVMSGYSATEQLPTGVHIAYLQKPFTLADLRAVLEAALG
jgi:PAS domain S-box-containing protein